MKASRILIQRQRGKGPSQQLEIEAIIASSPSVLGPGQLVIPPRYSLLHVPGFSGRYPAQLLLHESLETIDAHLVDQLCCGGQKGGVVPARLYNFLTFDTQRQKLFIEGDQVTHLYEHLLLHPLMRYRRVKNRRLQARTHGTVIYLDNTFTEEGDVVCQVVWECLARAFQGQTYPTIEELNCKISDALLQTKMVSSNNAAS